MTKFASDNVAPACPEVMDAIIEANTGPAASYGDDAWSRKLHENLSKLFETDVVVFQAVTGTAANALALSALTPPYGKIYCHELSHVNTDECGAPELFTGGAKLVPMPGENGKLTAEKLAATVYGRGNVHHAQPATISIAQSCESGAVYRLDEIAALGAAAREHKLKFHMDGARFANALVTLDASPAEMTWKSGVDVLTFGATKNGCFAAEALVFFDLQAADTFEFLHKRSGQLLSKSRFVSAQINAYVSNDVWLRNARHANAMAKRLSEGLAALPGIELAYPTEANEVFVRLAGHVVNKLQDDGFAVNHEELDGTAARFVTAWDTKTEDVDLLLASFSRHCHCFSPEGSCA